MRCLRWRAVALLVLALGAKAQPWEGARAWVDGELYRVRQNATRLFFNLRGDYDPRTDTVEATQEQNLEVGHPSYAMQAFGLTQPNREPMPASQNPNPFSLRETR